MSCIHIKPEAHSSSLLSCARTAASCFSAFAFCTANLAIARTCCDLTSLSSAAQPNTTSFAPLMLTNIIPQDGIHMGDATLKLTVNGLDFFRLRVQLASKLVDFSFQKVSFRLDSGKVIVGLFNLCQL